MNREEFRALAAETAIVLSQLRSEPWIMDGENPPGWNLGADLSGPGSARLHLSHGWHATGKVTIEGKFPDGWGRLTFTANIDPARGAAVIAREANRRVISAAYVDELRVVLERKAKHDQEQSERSAWLAKAAVLFARPAPEPGRRLDLSDFVAGHGYVEAYWTGSDRMSIDLSGIPAQTMLRMLAVLAQDCGGQQS